MKWSRLFLAVTLLAVAGPQAAETVGRIVTGFRPRAAAEQEWQSRARA